MIFTVNRTPFSPPIKLGGENINYVLCHKYLGVIFNCPRLTWKHHIKELNYSSLVLLGYIKLLLGLGLTMDVFYMTQLQILFYSSWTNSKICVFDSYKILELVDSQQRAIYMYRNLVRFVPT